MSAAIHVSLTLKQLGPALRSLGPKMRAGVVRGLRNGAGVLKTAVIAGIQSTEPHPPVDTGVYRAAWTKQNTDDGARVENLSPQAEFIERGRRPGPVSKEAQRAISDWVRRKGLYLDVLPGILRAARAKNGASLRAMAKADRSSSAWSGKTTTAKGARAQLKKDAIQEACDRVAFLIARKIKEKGYAPRHILANAIKDNDRMIVEAIRRAVEEVEP